MSGSSTRLLSGRSSDLAGRVADRRSPGNRGSIRGDGRTSRRSAWRGGRPRRPARPGGRRRCRWRRPSWRGSDAARNSGSTGPNETVRVTEAHSPCRRPVTAIVARLRIGRRLERGLAKPGQAVVAGDPQVDRARPPRGSGDEPGGRPRRPRARPGRSCGRSPRPPGSACGPARAAAAVPAAVSRRLRRAGHRPRAATGEQPCPPMSVATRLLWHSSATTWSGSSYQGRSLSWKPRPASSSSNTRRSGRCR